MTIQDIQSGTDRGVPATIARAGLTIASWPYGLAIRHRNGAYDRGSRDVAQAGVPVICIGNLTTGGTGKTPIVCHLAKWLREKNIRVSIVSRGYRSNESGTNDEAMELADRLPDVPHVQNVDRVEAARIAVEELETEVILMDDGFQHRRLHRDLDIVVIDAMCPFGYGSLLPRGLLREPISGLARASAVIITRTDHADEASLQRIESTIAKYANASVPVLRTQHAASHLLTYPDQITALETIANKRVVALSAIGNPKAFEDTLRACGATVTDQLRFPDHHDYGRETVQKIQDFARSQGSTFDQFLCTHKDLVKLKSDRIGGKPLSSLQIDMQFVSDPTKLYELVSQCVQLSR
ncbi:tetraacyldisaccharide 4'-kinase [Rubripirellula amarantea]|nr:tetraacyldisaccharide 4'-kinase [Rubripirellula amarantea]